MLQWCSPNDAAPKLPAQLILSMTDRLLVRPDQWIDDPEFMHRLNITNVLLGVKHRGSNENQLAQTLAAATTLHESASAVIASSLLRYRGLLLTVPLTI